MKLVSILIPAYNREVYLYDALLSAVHQTYQNLEIIICDNHSTDATVEVAAAFAAIDERVSIYRSDKNVGMAGNYRQILTLGSGHYIKFLNSDDQLASEAVERLLPALRDDDAVSVSTSAYSHIDENGAHLATVQHFSQSFTCDGLHAGRTMLSSTVNWIGSPSSVLFRRGALNAGNFAAYGGDDYRWLIDVPSWIQLLKRGRVAYCTEVLSHFRLHTHQISSSDVDIALEEWVKIIESTKEDFELSTLEVHQGLLAVIHALTEEISKTVDLSYRSRLSEVICRASSSIVASATGAIQPST
jgi:glycosyltransferase involved in cell wall biosynthesis